VVIFFACSTSLLQIAQEVDSACEPFWCKVTVTQKPRGGITITAKAVVGDLNLIEHQ